MPVHPRHLPERFGLLVLIVLGEGVIGVVLGTAHVSWTVLSGAVAFGGFLTAAAIWWLYFDFLDATSVVTRNVRSGLTYVYAHYFVTAGIAALGVGVKLAIFSVEPGPRYDHIGWIAAAGTALCMAGLAAIQFVTPPALFDADVLLRLVTAGVAGVLVVLSSVLSPVLIVWLLAAVLVGQVIAELEGHEGHSGGARRADLAVELGRHERELELLAAAQHAHRHGRADLLDHHQPLDVADVGDRRAVELDDQVLRPQPGLGRRRALDHLHDLDAGARARAVARAAAATAASRRRSRGRRGGSGPPSSARRRSAASRR